ncbi:MAG: cell wall hydrolase, partial [Phenylobacterium zucineum]
AYNRTGCQFSFACDGSMRRARDVGAWARARKVASRTLAGTIQSEVGSATHFHTINVSPGWGPRLLRVAQVGMHIFYRFGRGGASSFAPSRLPSVDDIAPSEIASLTADGRPPVVYAASALGRLEPASTTAPGMGGPVGAAVTEPASAPIATGAKTTPASAMSIKAPATAASTKAIPVSSDRAPLEGLKTTVGAGSGAAS